MHPRGAALAVALVVALTAAPAPAGDGPSGASATARPAGMGEPRIPASPPPKGVVPPVPPAYVRPKGPLPKEAVARADEVLKMTQYPIGTQIPFTIGGKEYLYVIEWHKHAPTDNVPASLKEWHRGVSVYVKK